MAEVVVINNTLTVQVTFRGPSGSPEDPVTTTVDVYNSDDISILHAIPTHISVGVFQFSWTPNLVGQFTMDFVGVFVAGQTSIPIAIDVVSSATLIFPSQFSLGQDREFVFITDNLSPLFIDSEQLEEQFPEASEAEIIELIYDFSQEANAVNESVPPNIPTPLMQEFVFNSVACQLTRLYGQGGGAGSTELTLGDLSVRNQRDIKDEVTRANATTWCELAAVVRAELYRFTKNSGMKAIVKGLHVIEPMPCRRISTVEWKSMPDPRWIY